MLDPTIDEHLEAELPDRGLAHDFVPIKPDCEWGYMRVRQGEYQLAIYCPGEGFMVSGEAMPEKTLDFLCRTDHELLCALDNARYKRIASLPWLRRLFGIGAK